MDRLQMLPCGVNDAQDMSDAQDIADAQLGDNIYIKDNMYIKAHTQKYRERDSLVSAKL